MLPIAAGVLVGKAFKLGIAQGIYFFPEPRLLGRNLRELAALPLFACG